MEIVTMEEQQPPSPPTLLSTDPPLIPPELLQFTYTESVAERMKRRQRPTSTVLAPAKMAKRPSKRQKTSRDAATIQTPTPAPPPVALPIDAIRKEGSPQTMLTPPQSDNGQLFDKIDVLELEDKSMLLDIDFAHDTLRALQQRLSSYNQCVGRRQTERIVQLLKVATPATPEEGPVLTEQEVKAYLNPGFYYDGPIFIKDQQPLPLMSIDELCAEFYDDNAGVWIQDPSMVDFTKSTREVRIGDVKERLNSSLEVEHPWNCLEMAAPFEDGLRPKFLNEEECRLLTKIKIPNPEPYYEGAKVGRRFLRHGYKEAEKWVLLAQSGALTEPHQDSHGYSTYITVNQGVLGYGWMHMPTETQRMKWIKNPHKFIEADWRYRILRPGDTVYFPAGTVHFVFRHPDAGHTLAFGGHVLRCSTIVQWIRAIKNEASNPAVTNEELTVAAAGFLDQVGTFVEQALQSSKPTSIARWGGEESIKTFLKLKSELLALGKSQNKAGRKDKV